MHILATVSAAIFLLSGCLPIAYLPATGDVQSGLSDEAITDVETLYGKSEEEIKLLFKQLPRELTVEDKKHLLYRQTKEFGLVVFVAGAPPLASIGADYLNSKRYCFRFSFDQEGRLFDFEKKEFDFSSYKSPVLDNAEDCRLAFWKAEELNRIREKANRLAEHGGLDAKMVLAREFGETAPLTNLAIENQDWDLARRNAEEFGDGKALAAFADQSRSARVRLLQNHLGTTYSPVWTSELTSSASTKLENETDPATKLALYKHSVGPNRLRWLCLAAEDDYALAQYELGNLFWYGESELEENKVIAYKWYLLAEKHDYAHAVARLKRLLNEITIDEISEARNLMSRSSPGDCERETRTHRQRPAADSEIE